MEKINYEQFKKIITKEELEELYPKHTVKWITEHYNVNDVHAVSRVMKEFGMKVYHNGSGIANDYDELMKRISYDDLYQYYITELHSHKECAKHFGVTSKVMWKIICKYNIKKGKHLNSLTGQKTKTKLYGDPFCKFGRSLYSIDNITFDSLPELALWLYAKSHNEKIIREPYKLNFTFNNKTYSYLPDFMYNDELVEIKGDHFFKEDGTMRNPYCKDEFGDNLEEAKHQCMIKNNVKILVEKDYNKYVNWFNNNYNKEDFMTRNLLHTTN